ncbi:hypothetical protein V9K67_16715 [Paraflavisolibacter sp. H34]|uniref:hypothetical protein n=1 Tax=Huijunlia imazamoxiresistens TaxID=3127457 RepID=UPI0030160373
MINTYSIFSNGAELEIRPDEGFEDIFSENTQEWDAAFPAGRREAERSADFDRYLLEEELEESVYY